MNYGESNSYQGGESNSYQGGGYEKPDASRVASYAKQHYQDNDDDDKSDLFGSVLSKVLNNGDHEQGILESEAQNAARAHEQVYTHENNVSSRDMGSAAAMQAFKMFSSNNSNGGGSSNELVGLAMGEAMKLFNKQGGSASGANQSEMLQSAAMMAMKLFMTQKSGGSGDSSSGGIGQIMGLLGSLGGGGGQQQQQQQSGIASMLGKFL
ncbi:hypothetical protein [Parasitella parasitica]|uniref:DUF7721 domain-containing protein n=1 Tax=Parasitella parasitica TaxID=35722 RepID=A0A0B7NIC2_9FUNG|nr:hypothetical protein [Parasitella parasitica]